MHYGILFSCNASQLLFITGLYESAEDSKRPAKSNIRVRILQRQLGLMTVIFQASLGCASEVDSDLGIMRGYRSWTRRAIRACSLRPRKACSKYELSIRRRFPDAPWGIPYYQAGPITTQIVISLLSCFLIFLEIRTWNATLELINLPMRVKMPA